MTSFNAIAAVTLFTIAQQYACAESLLPIETKDFAPKNKFGKYVIKLFREVILGEAEDVWSEYFDDKLKSFTTVMNIYMLVQDIALNTEQAHELALLATTLANLPPLFDKIDSAFATSLRYKRLNKTANDPAVMKFIDDTQNNYQGPLDYISTIYSIVVPKDIYNIDDATEYLNDVSILALLNKHMQGYSKLCNKHKSQQQIIQMLYMSVSAAEMKVYSTLEFCYRELAAIGKCNYREELEALKERFRDAGKRSIRMFKTYMSNVARDIWRCDPAIYTEDENYSQLYHVFQKYVANDEDLNWPHDCTKTCSSVTKGNITQCANKEANYDISTGYKEYSICDQQRKCYGDLYDCDDYFQEYAELWICPSVCWIQYLVRELDTLPYVSWCRTFNSTRRYEFMQHGSYNRAFGTFDVVQYGPKLSKNDCQRHVSYDYRDFGGSFDDIWRHCEICLCTCHDWRHTGSDRFINFRPAVADNDFVVTGVQIVKNNQTLHLQIQQGKLLEDGHIDEDTIHWKPIAKERTIYDLRSISWKQFKQVYLGVTEVPKGRVVVGLKFSNVYHEDTVMIALKTLSVPYNYTTGQLTYKTAYYIEPKGKADIYEPEFDPLPDYRNIALPKETKVDLSKCDISTKTEIPSFPQPNTKRYLEFTTTDFGRDLGQTMIPFLDIQRVQATPATPLAGVGFYHKGRAGYGGFLGLKLLTYDHSPYIE